MTLEEAAAVFWPDGVITVPTLRTAVRTGRLPVSRIGRRLFVTPRALAELGRCNSDAAAVPAAADEKPAHDDVLRRIDGLLGSRGTRAG